MNLFKNKYNWKDGDEVITTPLTFISTNHSILYENLKPVFADIDEYLCLDPQSIEENITPFYLNKYLNDYTNGDLVKSIIIMNSLQQYYFPIN